MQHDSIVGYHTTCMANMELLLRPAGQIGGIGVVPDRR
jgi:hypothetical protein